MGWWDKTKDRSHMQNFEDRNRVNTGIRNLKKLTEILRYCSKLVYQTNRGARRMVSQLSSSKVLSSYPTVVDMLIDADKMAMDSPKRFAETCNLAAKLLESITQGLEEDRSIFVQETMPSKLKGLVEDE